MPSPPPVGFVALQSDDPPLTVVARLGPERPDVSSGYGGWTEVARPRRTTVTTWTGQPARRLGLSVLIDNWYAGASVEDQIRALERMALPYEGKSPPTVTINAQGGHVPYTDLTWVVDTLTWGDALMNSHGNRVRQAATLELLEYVSDALIQARSRKSPAQKARAANDKKKGGKKGAAKKRKAATKGRKSGRKKSVALFAATAAAFDGEDLMAIAARELGDARRWREIADLNGIRDPRAITTGQVLRLP